ncbi:MAG TPA: hypothetical protein VHW46_07410 [Terracidiphilus sp.]|jgi:hypothetical protein|nr:hypothetical protein [Terracidiphilus sp.]
MPTNSYDSAFEQASNDRVEVRVAIEKLLTRGEMLDKLLETLAPFVSSPKPVGESEMATESHDHHHESIHAPEPTHHQG